MKGVKKFFVYFVGVLILTTTYWLENTFAGPTAEQIIFQTQYLNHAIGNVPEDLSYSYYYNIGCSFVIAFLLFFVDKYFYQSKHKINFLKKDCFQENSKLDKYVISKIYLWFLIFSLIFFFKTYASRLSMNSEFNHRYKYYNYEDPQKAEIEVDNPKNLIFIYMESIEDTYKDVSIFGKNLLKRFYDIKGISGLSTLFRTNSHAHFWLAS